MTLAKVLTGQANVTTATSTVLSEILELSFFGRFGLLSYPKLRSLLALAMSRRGHGVQWTIDAYFPTESPKEQLAAVTTAIDEDTSLTRQERRILSSDVTKAYRNSTRAGKKISTYSKEFINEVLRIHQERSKEEAMSFARNKLGRELPDTTFITWVKNSKPAKDDPEGIKVLNLKKRGRPVEMPSVVEKWMRTRLLFYLSKGVRITRLLTTYVLRELLSAN